jgi:hypothetical protein
MKGFRKAGRAYLSVSVLLIIAIALLVNVNVAKAENGDSINPDQLLNPIRSITLAQGQSASVGLSQIGPYGFNSVAVTSIGNTVASATLGSISAPSNLILTGLHITFIIGTGSFSPADMSVGFVPWGGTAATIDIGPISFYWATTNVFIISDEPITPENPATYTLTVR